MRAVVLPARENADVRRRRCGRDLPQRPQGRGEARRFWRDEYLLNAQIGRFAKPYVSVMDGIVMGGGVGVGAHGNTRVVDRYVQDRRCPRSVSGSFPTSAACYLLSRAPGALGLHAALTGAPFSGADAIALGFADHYVPHDELAAFTAGDRRRTVSSASATTPRTSAERLAASGNGSTNAIRGNRRPISRRTCAA